MYGQRFGYIMQAVAAHILLRLGCNIRSVKASGHPDIIAVRIEDGQELRFEVEAEAFDPKARQLTEPDIASLVSDNRAQGYYALAISFPSPYWIIVPIEKLAGRKKPCPNVLLEALRDREFSDNWTREHLALLQSSCRQVSTKSFEELSRMAESGCGL